MNFMCSLRKLGDWRMECVFSARSALAAIDRSLPKLILLDIKLQGELDGIMLAEIIRQNDAVPFVFIAAYSGEDTMRRARRTLPLRIPNKTGDHRELLETVAELMSTGYGFSQKNREIQK